MASRPAWINVGGVDDVGAATITAADDLITIAAHGLADGDMVMVDTLTGGADGPLIEDAVYFVREQTTDTFRVSGSKGGALIEFDSDGTANVKVAVPSYSAEELRQIGAVNLFHGAAEAVGARQGVRPGSGDPLSVSGTTWTVHTHTGVVNPAQTSTQGPYPYTQLETSGSLDPAHSSLDRIDGFDLLIEDDDVDASGFRRSRVVPVTGTPGSGEPAVTTGALRLGTILVPSGGSPSPTVASLAVWTGSSCSVLPVRDDTERPSAGRYEMLLVGREDTGALEAWHDNSWTVLAAAGSFQLLDRVVYTSSSSFDKTSYPGIRAVHVEVQAGGGGGGGTNATGAGEAGVGGGGGGGEYRRGWILDASLSDSTTVTVGVGGSGGANAADDGNTGGVSSFGSHVSCNGGGGGTSNDVGTGHLIATGGNGGGGGSGGYLTIAGDDGDNGYRGGGFVAGGLRGGASHLGGSQRGNGTTAGGNGATGQTFGGGGSAGHNNQSQGSSRSGGNGGQGVIVVEIYG